jgi:hypothetical protein
LRKRDSQRNRRPNKIANFTEEELEEFRAHDKQVRNNWIANFTAERFEGFRAHRNEAQRNGIREKLEGIYSVQSRIPLELEATPTATEDGVSIIVCGRVSKKVDDATFEDAKGGNEIVLRKFITDLVTPIPVLATESKFWNGGEAWAPLPWVAMEDDHEV